MKKKNNKKEIKTIKTFKEYFVNYVIVILKNKKMTKKSITKINRNLKKVENSSEFEKNFAFFLIQRLNNLKRIVFDESKTFATKTKYFF